MSEKTIVYTPESGSTGNTASLMGMLTPLLSRSGIDASTIAALSNRGGLFGNGDMFSSLIALLVVWGIFGNNGFGNGFGGNGAGAAALGNLINNNDGRELLMQAIQGNRTAISELASTLNVSVSALQTSLNNISTSLLNVGNQVGMSSMQIINAIQAGNCDLASKFASCCCETKQAITQQGYENRLATLQQTDTLSARIDAQTTMINDKFCQLEMREMQNKIDSLSQQNTILRTTIDNANQTAAIQGFVGQTIAPVNAQLAALNKEVDDIKCKLPNTVNVQYPNLAAVPAGLVNGLYAGIGYGIGSGYGNGFFG